MQLKCLLSWIYVLALSFILLDNSAAENENKLSLTVEGGVSLVGPHCPGTVRLFCEGVNLITLGWTCNEGNLIFRVENDHMVGPHPLDKDNPAFVSVYVTNISVENYTQTNSPGNFSSVLTVDPLELNKQNIRSITCGDISEKVTLEVNIKEYFTPSVIASYRLGTLNKIEVDWIKLQSVCSEYNISSLKYTVNEYDVVQSRSCGNASCYFAITDFSMTNDEYELRIAAANYSHTLKMFNISVAFHRMHYFIWNINSTSCELYTKQCDASSQNVSDRTQCRIKHNYGINQLNTQNYLPYLSPSIFHHFKFSANVSEHFLIMENITIIEPLIGSKATVILTITSLYLLLALIHLLLIIICGFCKATILITKKGRHTIGAFILIVLAFICTVLLFALGIKTNDACSPNWKILYNSLLEVMIVISCLGISFVTIVWILMAYGFYKHRATCRRISEGDGHLRLSKGLSKTSPAKATESPRNAVCALFINESYGSHKDDKHEVLLSTVEGRRYDPVKIKEQADYDTLKHSHEPQDKAQHQNSQNQKYQYEELNKETMLANPREASCYMQLRAREKSRPVHNLSDTSYSHIGKREPEAAVPDIISSNRTANKRDNYDIIARSTQISTSAIKVDNTLSSTLDSSQYETINLGEVDPCCREVYNQLRPSEKSKPVPNMDDSSYSHVHLASVKEEKPVKKLEKICSREDSK